MSYKDKFELSDKKALNSLIATKILDRMNEMRTEADENSARRWIWELLQNAKDAAFDSQKIDAKIDLDEDPDNKKVIFSHNGMPFSVDNITFLIKQVSTKERNPNSVNVIKKPTGKFGTGFLTTHLLSEKVEVTGVVKEPDLHYRGFVLPLNRSGRTTDEIIESVNASISVRDTLDINNPLLDYKPQAFNTSFLYNLDDKGLEVAKAGIEDLHISLPYTLTFAPSINSVMISHMNSIYELVSVKKLHEEIELVKIQNRNNNIISEINIVKITKNRTSIAIEIEKKNSRIWIKAFSEDLPRLFCDFPLIGTNDFTLPVIVNSSGFNPRKERDGIGLTDHNNEPEVLENKTLFLESLDSYFKLLNYAIENNWGNLFYLAITDTPKEKKWFSKIWFETYFQKPIREKLLTLMIVELESGKHTSIKNEEGNDIIYFPSHSNDEIRTKIWELEYKLFPDKIPGKEYIHNWYKVMWGDFFKDSLKAISEFIEGEESIEKLSERTGNDTAKAIKWLNEYFDLLNFEGKFIEEIIGDKYAVIPNQKNLFKKRSELRIDKNIEEELKNVLDILGIDARNYLKHKQVKTASKYKEETKGQILYTERTQEEIIDEINKIIKEGKNTKISTACDYLSSCYVDEIDFPNEQQKIYDFCDDIWDMPTKRILQNWDVGIWKEVNRLQIKWLVKSISACKNLKSLQEKLTFDETETLKWLNSFVEFLVGNGNESHLNLKESPILPNQSGVFCIKDVLFLDDGEIGETLKDILESLGFLIKQELLAKSIFLELPKSRERNSQFVADEIKKLISPRFSELPRTEETKQIFKSLYLWFNKNKFQAEKLFPELFGSKHKLYDDDEIAANLGKAEILDEIINDFGLSPKEIKEKLRQLASINNSKVDISSINELISISEKIGGIGDILEHARELLQDQQHFDYMREIGQNVELVFKEALLQEGINAIIIHQGWGSHDFEVRNPKNNESMFIELKSFASGSSGPFKLAISQAEKAIEKPNKFALCVFERPAKSELIEPNHIKKALKYRKGISSALHSAIQDNSELERIKNNKSNIHLYISLRDDVRVSIGYDFMMSNCTDFSALIEDIKEQIK